MRKLFMISAMMLSMQSCATDRLAPPAPTPVANNCGHQTIFKPDPGFETRWTRREREALAVMNRNVKADCR